MISLGIIGEYPARIYQYLGLNPALSNNVLSVLLLVSMLILVMTLGAVRFGTLGVLSLIARERKIVI